MIDKNSVASALLYASRSGDYSGLRGRGPDVADAAKANPVGTKNLIQDINSNRAAIQDRIELSPAAIDAMRNKAENSGASDRIRAARDGGGEPANWDIPSYREMMGHAEELFNFLDADGDGFIKKSELVDGIKTADAHMNNKEILKIAANAFYAFDQVAGEDGMVGRDEIGNAITVGYNNEFGPELVNRVLNSGMDREDVLSRVREARDKNSLDEILRWLENKMGMGEENGGGSFNVGDGNTGVEGSGSAANGAGASVNPAGDAFWSQFDTDESGFVTDVEFEAWLSSASNPELTPEELKGAKDDAQTLWDNLLAAISENGLAEEGQPENSVSFAQYQDWLATFGPQPPEPGVEVGDSGGTGEEGGESELIES